MNRKLIVDSVNTLSKFCEIRDIDSLDKKALFSKYNVNQVDVCVLFGGNNLSGADAFANAINSHIAHKYIIVGGIGHATNSLKRNLEKYMPNQFKNDTEAELLNEYLRLRYHYRADFLEKESTNAGNNISNLLDLLSKEGIKCESILLIQDAPIQRRMDAVLRKYRPKWMIVNYASYDGDVELRDGKLVYKNEIAGAWPMDEYISILIGEIDRLKDDKSGYGPNGKNYIVHVEVPKEVITAQKFLLQYTNIDSRKADSKYGL